MTIQFRLRVFSRFGVMFFADFRGRVRQSISRHETGRPLGICLLGGAAKRQPLGDDRRPHRTPACRAAAPSGTRRSLDSLPSRTRTFVRPNSWREFRLVSSRAFKRFDADLRPWRHASAEAADFLLRNGPRRGATGSRRRTNPPAVRSRGPRAARGALEPHAGPDGRVLPRVEFLDRFCARKSLKATGSRKAGPLATSNVLAHCVAGIFCLIPAPEVYKSRLTGIYRPASGNNWQDQTMHSQGGISMRTMKTMLAAASAAAMIWAGGAEAREIKIGFIAPEIGRFGPAWRSAREGRTALYQAAPERTGRPHHQAHRPRFQAARAARSPRPRRRN